MDADRARLRQSLEKAQRRPSVEAPANCVPCEIRSLEEQIDIANCGRQYLKSEVHKIEIIHSDVRTLETTIDEIETDRALIVYDREVGAARNFWIPQTSSTLRLSELGSIDESLRGGPSYA